MDVLRQAHTDLNHRATRETRAHLPQDLLDTQPQGVIARSDGEADCRRVREAYRVVVHRQQRPRPNQKGGAVHSRTDEARCAFQQLSAERSFQRFQPLADYGLHGPGRLGRAREVAELDCKHE
jgi:hypothetical protein